MVSRRCSYVRNRKCHRFAKYEETGLCRYHQKSLADCQHEDCRRKVTTNSSKLCHYHESAGVLKRWRNLRDEDKYTCLYITGDAYTRVKRVWMHTTIESFYWQRVFKYCIKTEGRFRVDDRIFVLIEKSYPLEIAYKLKSDAEKARAELADEGRRIEIRCFRINGYPLRINGYPQW